MERSQIGVKSWLSNLRSFVFQHGETVANVNAESDCRLSPDVVSILTNPLEGNLLRSHNERSETLPEDIEVIQAGEPLVYEKDFSWTNFRVVPWHG